MANEPDQGAAPDSEHAVTAAVPAETRIQLPTGPDGKATDAAQSVPQSATRVDPPAWLKTADLLIAALVLTLGFLLGSFAATNSDVWMHLATGRLIAQGEYTFGDDPFSFTSTGPWINHSWLYSWLFYDLFNQVGGQGLVIIKALGVVLLGLILFRIRFANTSRWVTAFGVLLALLAMSPRLLLQPTVVSLVFFAMTVFILHRAGTFATRLNDEEFSPGALAFAAAVRVLGEPRQLVHPSDR